MNLSGADDWDLANQADPAAMDELFRRHRDFVFRVLLGHTGNQAVSEDLTQEVFIRVATRRKPFFKSAKFTTFLFRIAANLVRDQVRRQRRELPLADIAEEHQRPDTEDDQQQDIGLSRALAAALARLPKRQREVIILRELEQFTTEETAQHLGISTGSVKTHRSRGLHHLKAYFVVHHKEQLP
ncbi:MAG: RNA polymerase sigma factor [Lysobacterales bacterium]